MFQVVLLVVLACLVVILLGLLVEVVVRTERDTEVRLDGVLCTDVKASWDVCRDGLVIVELRNSSAVVLRIILQTYLSVELVTC